jgi:hypothetical protein
MSLRHLHYHTNNLVSFVLMLATIGSVLISCSRKSFVLSYTEISENTEKAG